MEDGQVLYDQTYPDFKTWGGQLPRRSNLLTIGCSMTDSGKIEDSINMTVVGRMADYQLWDRLLGVDEVSGMHACRRRNDSLLDLDSPGWVYMSEAGLSAKETVSFDVACRGGDGGGGRPAYAFVPSPLGYREAAADCQKFGGRVVGYPDRESFDLMVGTFGDPRYSRAVVCEDHKNVRNDSRQIVTWLAVTDGEEEGVFRDRYTGRVLSDLPFAEGRPYANGFDYSCASSIFVYRKGGPDSWRLDGAAVKDRTCGNHQYCSICELAGGGSVKMRVRGLCSASFYDRTYHYAIDNDGRPVYYGLFSSSIKFDPRLGKWLWLDRLNNASVATITATPESFALGRYMVSFVRSADVCLEGVGQKVVPMKLTTCPEVVFFYIKMIAFGLPTCAGMNTGFQRWLFKDYFRRDSDLCRRANRFLGGNVGVETGFHAGVGRNAD